MPGGVWAGTTPIRTLRALGVVGLLGAGDSRKTAQVPGPAATAQNLSF